MAKVLPLCWANFFSTQLPSAVSPAEEVLPFRAGYALQDTASTALVERGWWGASARITHPDFLDARRKVPCTHCQPDGTQ